MQVEAIVINVRTDIVATLALASLRRNAPGAPLVLVNCEPSEKSRAHFARLAGQWGFTVVEEPVRPHGIALDKLFRSQRSELTLLLDSDAEVLNPEFVQRCLKSFENDNVFGAGFVHEAGWMGRLQGHGEGVGYYQERAWLPFVIFRTAMVRAALDEGHSFRDFMVFNDVAFSPRLSRLLASRFQSLGSRPAQFAELPEWLKTRLAMQPWPRLAWLRRDFYGQKPNYVYYDTGASVYQYCKYTRDWIFAGVDCRLHEADVAHYHGVTRQTISGDRLNATPLASVEQLVAGRLREYGVDASDLVAFKDAQHD